ncbi:MAG TPA: hypothetical protein VGM20_05640 [Gemmatimonadales bacterium]|jgi:hypothetical protein
MAIPTHSDLSGKVNALIERFFGGNRSAAARTWRVPQPTVQRLAVGDTETVRASTLMKIAATHETSVDWLLNGRGPDPLATDPLPFVEYTDLEQIVDSLGLSAVTRRYVLDLPKTISTAHSILCDWGTVGPDAPPSQPDDVVQVARDAKYKASALQYVSWAYLFDGMIKAYGRERVREKLESEVRRIRLGFHPVPLELMWMKEAAPILDALDARLALYGGGPVGVAMYDDPPILALNSIPPESSKPKRGRPAKVHRSMRG